MKLRHRLLLLLIAFITLAAFVIDLAAGVLIDRVVMERALGRLRSESELLARQLESSWPADPHRADAWADTAGSALALRVSVIDSSGVVLGDSDVALADLASLENHLGRAEVVAAATAGTGLTVRHSASIGRDVQYLARRVGPVSSPLGYVRLAIPVTGLQAVSRRSRALVTVVSVGSLALLVACAYVLVKRFTRRIELLSATADAVAAGSYGVALGPGSDDEVGRLQGSFDQMRRALLEQMDRTESERRLLASILGGLREGILAVDRDRRVLLTNEAFRSTFEAPRRTSPGTPMIEVTWDPAVLEAYEQALSSGGHVTRRVTIPDGRSFELTVVPFADAAGRYAGVVGLFFDVTRIDALERVRKDFVADISHELRTPLASVRAALETLLGGALQRPEEAEKFAAILLKNVARMEAILDDLTDLSLIETGAISLAPVPVELAAAVRDAAASIAPRAAARRVAVESRVPSGILVNVDRRRFDQILTNLLDNAVKFNRVGGSVVVTARSEGAGATLAVEDTGPGIPPDALDRVFNRLFRVDRARSQEVSGTGLGLAIVKHLVRLHGGEIRAENREGGGSRFVVDLPGRVI